MTEGTVTCFFTGRPLARGQAVRLTLHLGTGTQDLFTSKDRLRALVHPDVPLPPGLFGGADPEDR